MIQKREEFDILFNLKPDLIPTISFDFLEKENEKEKEEEEKRKDLLLCNDLNSDTLEIRDQMTL